MKKLFLFLVLLLILFCAGTYIFIPSTLTVSSTTSMLASENGTARQVLEPNNWPRWWTYLHTDTSSPDRPLQLNFTVGSDSFRLTEKFYKSAKINISHQGRQIATELIVIPLSTDSTGIQWHYSEPSSMNPFKRFQQYRDASKIKKNMDSVLLNLSAFLVKLQNVYGIPITRTSITDTLFLSAKTVSLNYPHTPDIYALIKKIQAYAAKQGLKQTGSPIYNIMRVENKDFQLMAAIPVDRAIPDQHDFVTKHMVRGSFIVTEVLGGEHAVDKAWQDLLLYFNDYRKTSMAINFSMLITDRMYQPDSSRWITRLYQPVY